MWPARLTMRYEPKVYRSEQYNCQMNELMFQAGVKGMSERSELIPCNLITRVYQPARLAQSVEHETLNLRVVGSSPTSGDFIFFFTLTF